MFRNVGLALGESDGFYNTELPELPVTNTTQLKLNSTQLNVNPSIILLTPKSASLNQKNKKTTTVALNFGSKGIKLKAV